MYTNRYGLRRYIVYKQVLFVFHYFSIKNVNQYFFECFEEYYFELREKKLARVKAKFVTTWSRRDRQFSMLILTIYS